LNRIRSAIGWLLPVVLLAAGAALVASQVSRPAAVVDMWRPWGEIGALACAMTAIMLTGGIDLSVGSTMALSSVCFGLAWQHGFAWPVAASLAVATGLGCGIGNAIVIATGVPPLVATLATMALYAGAALALSGGTRVAGLPEAFCEIGQGSTLGLPNQFWLLAVVWCVAVVFVHHTRFGRYLYPIGENRIAARFAAIPVRQLEGCLYAASGLLAGLVAVVYTARGGAAVPNAGAGIELQTIACVVMGGTRVTGGSGGLGRTLLGLAIMSLLDIGLQFVSHEIRLPWSGAAWQLSANARLILLGSLVIGVAIWNERLSSRRIG
jgi:rhamnose transport system permease protein